MSRKTLTMDDRLSAYLCQFGVREPDIARALREETAGMPESNMQIAPEQGQFLDFLIRAIGARRTLEIGVYTGYSALITALALPEDGELIACDINAQWTATAQRYWQQAGVSNRIRLHLRPALETLRELIDSGESGQFDFAFIDADKTGYAAYFEACLDLLRPGGIIAVDNTLWSGHVADPAVADADTVALRAFNAARRNDERIDLSLLPIADGLTLARKRT
ncbi:MAG TPA: class I SAM-dependent methyltransferase [Candidatus Acidoferrales bacterium]|nr:class I SAM-dependent methyltransferase [Candidatus Acidoferrales bacterium]